MNVGFRTKNIARSDENQLPTDAYLHGAVNSNFSWSTSAFKNFSIPVSQCLFIWNDQNCL